VQRSATLDGIRGVAIALVVGFHAMGTFTPPRLHPLLWPLAGGTLGVDLFFVLSGYLLVTSWESKRSLRTFWRRRLTRIFPAYWLSLAILIPLQAPHLLHELPHIALFASLQTFLVPRLPWAVNASYWSLTPEIHFYLLLPLIYAVLTKLGARRTLVILFAISVAWRIFSTSHYHFPADLLPGRIDQFAIGMAAATAGEGARAFAQRWCAVAAGVALAIALPLYGWIFWTTGGDPPHLFEALAHPAVGVLLGIAFLRLRFSGRVRALESKPIVALGAVSYSLYLWHLPVLMLVHKIGRAGPHLVAGVVAALIVAIVSYFAVERPLLRRRTHRPVEPQAEPLLVAA
jgi:peptidoglycan/LPS O-acetylase OafA/YrhL